MESTSSLDRHSEVDYFHSRTHSSVNTDKLLVQPVNSSGIWRWDTGEDNSWQNFIRRKYEHEGRLFYPRCSSQATETNLTMPESYLNSPWLYLPIYKNQIAKIRFSFHWIMDPKVIVSPHGMDINFGEIQLRLTSEANNLVPTGQLILFEIFADVTRYYNSNSHSEQDRYRFCKSDTETWIKNGPLLTKRLSIAHLAERQSIGICCINPKLRNEAFPPVIGLRTKFCSLIPN
ncbi:hypothetical protein Ciccas_007275 [Cichlidogyrus casuarinus]|uniref:Uncharacterized protein n=1 Tax=Cichlidogyrus casuarinus TaxID=1844966 RepID=A0ABD2Q3C7_9PLAT